MITGMGAIELAVMIAFGVLLGSGWGVMRFRSSHGRRIRESMRTLSRQDIATLRPGRAARVVGRVVPVREPMRAPLTGTPCVYYSIVVRDVELRRDLLREAIAVDFTVRDATGSALVQVRGGELDVQHELHRFVDLRWEARPDLDAFLRSRNLGGSPSLLLREAVLAPDQAIQVVGLVDVEHDPAPPPGEAGGYRDAPTRPVFRSRHGAPVLLSDRIEQQDLT